MTPINKVLTNIEQNLSEEEKATARANSGAAALASLAASFESRAPNYNWAKDEVCTYNGALWIFDRDHTGAWDSADVHEGTLMEVVSTMSIISEKPTTILSAPIYIGGDPTDLDIYTYANAGRAQSVTFSAKCVLAFTANGFASGTTNDFGEVTFDASKTLKIKRARIKTPGSIGLGAGNGKKGATFYMVAGDMGTPFERAGFLSMQFSAFNEWENMNFALTPSYYSHSIFKLAILQSSLLNETSKFVIDDYNMQSAYVGQTLQAYLEIEIESDGLATT